MSLTGAIVTRYNDDSDSDATALRAAVGVGKCWADTAPDSVAMPYIVVDDVATAQVSEAKGQTYRVEEVTIQFDVWATTKASVEEIIELIDDCYVGASLTISNRSHLSTHKINHNTEEEKPRLWHGTIDLLVSVEKSG